ncbi:MAG: histidine phosphatase family protein [Cyanobacteria bacterium Co-bin8]|nr:histidine phosphatase family protein [Cyanobacteria bacterium Co-bin8]
MQGAEPKLILIRHGQTAVNVEGRVHGQGDRAGLDEVGRWQVQRLAQRCQQYGVQSLLSSPELRAMETAGAIAEELGLPLEVIEGIQERNWGDWAEEPWSAIKARLDLMSLEERFTFVPPGGESWQQMEQRLLLWCQRWQQISHTTAVVGHGGVLRALIPLLLQEPRESSLRYDLANASVSVFEVKSERFEVVELNEIGHLEVMK